MEKICVDYQKALRQADRLDECAGEIQVLASGEMEDIMQAVAAAWKGENAEKFLLKEEKIGNELEKTGKDIQRIADSLRNAARRWKATEDLAEKIAGDRG